MNIDVKSVHFKADQKLVDFTNKKVNKLDQYFDGIIGADVMMKVDKTKSPKNKIVEVELSIPGHENLFAEKQADTFEEAVDLSVEAIKKQLKKFKEKLHIK